MLRLSFDKRVGSWKSFFFMANVNYRIVERSNAFLGYGDGMVYSESALQKSFLAGCMFYNVILWFSAAIMNPLVKKLYIALGIVPAPGDSTHDEKSLESGYLNLFAQGEGDKGAKVNLVLRFFKDVGYKETARMIVESGL